MSSALSNVPVSCFFDNLAVMPSCGTRATCPVSVPVHKGVDLKLTDTFDQIVAYAGGAPINVVNPAVLCSVPAT